MAVTSVRLREIVEVPYQLPDGSIKPHMALVLSTEKLQLAEDGMFYCVLISSKNENPEFTIAIRVLSKCLQLLCLQHEIFLIFRG